MTGEMPLIVILGPTAVGKTGLAIELADALNGEIIGADSRQIFRLMDIGTAKPTPQQRAQIPHHLIDLIDPDENLGLAQYQRLAYTTIDETVVRGHIPFLVGGTGQYITAVVEGWTIPQVAPNEVLRGALETYAAEHGSEALHTRLQAVDPVAACNIHHKNVRRVVRALEVSIEAGKPISDLQRKTPPPFRILQYGLTMREKQALLSRADQRVDDMMQQGFLEEVQNLLERGYGRSLASMSGLGYRELSSHLLDGVPLDEAVAATKLHTRDFIRRQYTWFRGHDTGILWQNIEEIHIDQFIATIRQSL